MSVTAHQISNAADITYRQVDFWTRNGYLVPDQGPAFLQGTGYPRDYPRHQLDHAVLMAHLVRAGFLAKAAHTVALALEEHGTAQLGPFTLTPAATSTTNPTGARTA